MDVERLVEKKGYTKQRAFKEIATKYKMSSTISTRYKVRAIEARKLKLTPVDIKVRYGLTQGEEIIPV
ncbi:MAG: hypothetical protein ACM3SR_10530 [Ignavibacteriales bacterium]